MRESQKIDLSGYRQRDNVEHEGYDEARSIAHGERNNQDGVSNLWDRVFSNDNILEAYHRVVGNKGAAGVDGMTFDQLFPYLNENWMELRNPLYNGTYKPKPVRRVEIPKDGGGMRKLGIPTVVDRMIQQAISQVLQGIFDPTFSESSYGFRPGRSAHMAINQAKTYYEEGYKYVVDIDLKAYFDTLNHDKLMHYVEEKIKDKRVLNLIRLYLRSGIMDGGIAKPTELGAPQGGPLSPILSNIYLDKFDKMLESRGHRFARYADDSAPRKCA